MQTHFAAPVEVGFELLPYCNLRCIHCYCNAGPEQPRAGLSLQKIEALCDELVELQVFKIYLGGGEPFARRDFFDILRLASERSLGVSISTNGTLLTEKHVETLCRFAPVPIQVSLDGARARTHDRIRGGRSFERAVRAVQLLAREGLCPAIGTVACQSNLQEIPGILQLALDLGARSFHLMGLQPAGRGLSRFESERLREEQWLFLYDFFCRRARALSRVIDLRIEIDKQVLYKHRLVTLGERADSLTKLWWTCPCSRSSCTITANGDVLACELMRDVVAGNVYRQPLREIWRRSPALQAVRRRSLGITACTGCRYWDCCQGGCAAAVHNLTGGFAGADPRCELARQEASHA